ncbi:MAG: hypothetical protein K0S65_1899 [Labilithrix sp.]|nr:hypothetical protein [Labilithrix sp.]
MMPFVTMRGEVARTPRDEEQRDDDAPKRDPRAQREESAETIPASIAGAVGPSVRIA